MFAIPFSKQTLLRFRKYLEAMCIVLKPNLSFSRLSPDRTLFQARHLRKFNGFSSWKQNPWVTRCHEWSKVKWTQWSNFMAAPQQLRLWFPRSKHRNGWCFKSCRDHCCKVRKESTHISDKFEHFWWFALTVFGLRISCLPVNSMEENGNVFSSIFFSASWRSFG